MRTDQFTAWKCGRFALVSTALVVSIACSGAEAPDLETDMEAAVTDAGMTGDFVSRPLPNPTAEVILN